MSCACLFSAPVDVVCVLSAPETRLAAATAERSARGHHSAACTWVGTLCVVHGAISGGVFWLRCVEGLVNARQPFPIEVDTDDYRRAIYLLETTSAPTADRSGEIFGVVVVVVVVVMYVEQGLTSLACRPLYACTNALQPSVLRAW